MEGCMTDMICVSFQFGEAPYILNDALCLTQAQWDALTPEEVAAMQQARYDNWREAMTRPPTIDPPEEVI
jgi:hypothetical protein